MFTNKKGLNLQAQPFNTQFQKVNVNILNHLRYWKSVHGNGKYAIWNCGLKWIIGKAEDMPNCLSWAESDYESKVKQHNNSGLIFTH